MDEEFNSVESIRDDLDNYGGHVPVLIEDNHGRFYVAGQIYSYNFNGRPYVVIQCGDKF